MSREFELKFSASEAQLDAVQAAYPGQYQTTAMETIYYDTPQGALSARKWTLRLRLEDGVPVCTLKTPAGAYCRGEWACRSGTITSAIAQLVKSGCPRELEGLTAGGLVPVCGARFQRRWIRLPLPDGTVELALDRGVLFGGGRELPFAEAEVEQKSGSEAAAEAFARRLAARFALTEEPKSKFQRALALAMGG